MKTMLLIDIMQALMMLPSALQVFKVSRATTTIKERLSLIFFCPLVCFVMFARVLHTIVLTTLGLTSEA